MTIEACWERCGWATGCAHYPGCKPAVTLKPQNIDDMPWVRMGPTKGERARQAAIHRRMTHHIGQSHDDSASSRLSTGDGHAAIT